MQYVYGQVFNNATFSGAGIASISNNQVGFYDISFENYFSTPYGVTASPWGSGMLVAVNIFAENMVQVQVTDLQGNPVNEGFSFIALGEALS
ncbi:hypothetical protein KFE98_20370 [bacterium SCSIO 12741]|nr:hypothetical protein KFE98_20370 [bacterium SCSIO 12741]